ncbi:ABC transporter permease [Succinivibrio sp.]|uniref:ABC transporter permease n=1 Tax=Succinivibrio sp. TaxID=2053619 RepID=UPI002586924C|nr:ABC transporter permease [Succinivibrio sp.]MCI6938630.1 ABC transporter permease [Succinatimonas hippei]MDD6206698.1 ABC transporter permease [Succinivibrio sp.]
MDISKKFGSIRTSFQEFIRSKGGKCALPVYILLAAGFLAPLFMVFGFSFATPRTYDAFTSFSLENFIHIFDGSTSVWRSYVWSIALAACVTAILAVVCYPIAVGMVRIFGRKTSSFISILFVFPLFVSENVRLYGWILFFGKNGVLDGVCKFLGFNGPDVLFTPEMTAMGLAYSFLPYMLFPVIMGVNLVPKDLLTAARDLGASRLRTWWQIELPLAMPGVLIGMLLTFVLATGSMSESKILGGQSIIVITNDIDVQFTFSQNWPQGAALAVILTILIGALTLYAFKKIDLDKLMGKA